MDRIEEFVNSSHYRLVESVISNDTDHLLLYIAVVSMKFSGHRYGSFLDAAATAAKLAIYTTYLEQGRNLRRTGFIHHVETKRVKAIVQEVEAAILEGEELKSLGSREPQYLIGIPHLWMKKFPYTTGARISAGYITQRDLSYIEAIVPRQAPAALVITEAQLLEVIQEMHESCQRHHSDEKPSPLSDAMLID